MASYSALYNNQINARALIGQSAMSYCAGKPTEKKRASFELLYKSNRPQVSMGYRLINHLPWDVGRTLFSCSTNIPRDLSAFIREVKHDVYGRRQTAKIASDFLFFSCNP